MGVALTPLERVQALTRKGGPAPLHLRPGWCSLQNASRRHNVCFHISDERAPDGLSHLPAVQPLDGRTVATQDSKTASIVPLKERKLMDVKLGGLPSWMLMWDFTLSGIAGAFQQGYYQYYNKYFNVKKGSIAVLSMVLTPYVVFSYCLSYKELKHEWLRKYH
ncbi:PREDICTED: ATP synthase subunit f, mitochondrial-like [Elephantulus edwardii]|uniref:ATP synthase subunit f, mitochondrial-like n=1 Tax=Elephantulus edwardii TaxID=28737 RepID=UPI0003F0C9B1|nr:PREDICTED: ATP synthase subunit f, mitochondrial-like [Elephantulus edwardii]